MQNFDIPLHDIKPIVEIGEYSFYYFLFLSTVAFLVACVIVYLLYLWFKRKKAFNVRKEHKKLLNGIDLSDTKKAAYLVTLYGATFSRDSARHAQMYQNVMNRLEAYKYKTNVDVFDAETVAYIELYKGILDV